MGSRKLVLGLGCSRLLGRESRPGASVVSAERATRHRTARTRDPHGDTQQRAKPESGRGGSNKGAPSAGREEGACGRVRLRRA